MISKLKLAAYAGAFALAFFIGYQYSQNQSDKVIAEINLGHSEYLRLVAEANAQVILKQSKEIESLIGKNTELDIKLTEEMKSAQQNTDRLASSYERDIAGLRVRLKSSCSTSAGTISDSTTSSSVDGEGERAQLHPEISANLVRLIGEADQCQIKVGGLQEYVEGLMETYGPASKK